MQNRQGYTLKTMIRLNALDCKLKNTILSVRNLFRQSLEQSPLFLLVCPYCGAKGTCKKGAAMNAASLPSLMGSRKYSA